MELVDKMRERRGNMACLQETKGKEIKLKNSMDIIIGILQKDNNRYDIGIIVDKDVKDKGLDIKRVSIRLLLINLMLEEEITNVINAYAPQVGLTKRIKK
ncbi:hypothetical protein AMTRI_Chr13g90130 [Amborella trichopoda]